MIRPPPRSTLFPYTTLSRSVQAHQAVLDNLQRIANSSGTTTGTAGAGTSTGAAASTPSSGRSEEHTSELQSRQYLVCRLLLETKQNPRTHYGSTTLTPLTPH